MVNVHQTTSTTWPEDLLWYDGVVSEADALRSWGILAELLCPHWNAFAADLVNEPVKASWGRGEPTDWNKAAERFGDKVLSVCPRLLIMVQGVGGEPGAPNDGGISEGYFWGENLVGAATSPVQLVDMTKLVYSPHTCKLAIQSCRPFLTLAREPHRSVSGLGCKSSIASASLLDRPRAHRLPHGADGPGVYKDQPYFPGRWQEAPGFPANMAQVWDRHFGTVQQATGRAVVIGEVPAPPKPSRSAQPSSPLAVHAVPVWGLLHGQRQGLARCIRKVHCGPWVRGLLLWAEPRLGGHRRPAQKRLGDAKRRETGPAQTAAGNKCRVAVR